MKKDAVKKDAKITKELTFQIGGYSNKMQAEQEAREFAMPSVFERRSGTFPNPANFKIEVKPVSAVVQPWPDPPSPMNQFFVLLKVVATGATEASIDDWAKKVNSTIRVFHSTSAQRPGESGDRAAHLRYRAEQGKKK